MHLQNLVLPLLFFFLSANVDATEPNYIKDAMKLHHAEVKELAEKLISQSRAATEEEKKKADVMLMDALAALAATITSSESREVKLPVEAYVIAAAKQVDEGKKEEALGTLFKGAVAQQAAQASSEGDEEHPSDAQGESADMSLITGIMRNYIEKSKLGSEKIEKVMQEVSEADKATTLPSTTSVDVTEKNQEKSVANMDFLKELVKSEIEKVKKAESAKIAEIRDESKKPDRLQELTVQAPQQKTQKPGDPVKEIETPQTLGEASHRVNLEKENLGGDQKDQELKENKGSEQSQTDSGPEFFSEASQLTQTHQIPLEQPKDLKEKLDHTTAGAEIINDESKTLQPPTNNTDLEQNPTNTGQIQDFKELPGVLKNAVNGKENQNGQPKPPVTVTTQRDIIDKGTVHTDISKEQTPTIDMTNENNETKTTTENTTVITDPTKKDNAKTDISGQDTLTKDDTNQDSVITNVTSQNTDTMVTTEVVSTSQNTPLTPTTATKEPLLETKKPETSKQKEQREREQILKEKLDKLFEFEQTKQGLFHEIVSTPNADRSESLLGIKSTLRDHLTEIMKLVDLTNKKTFEHIDIRLFNSLALYNELIKPLSGAPYICALDLRADRNPEQELKGLCKEQMEMINQLHNAVDGVKIFKSAAHLPTSIKSKLVEKFTKEILIPSFKEGLKAHKTARDELRALEGRIGRGAAKSSSSEPSVFIEGPPASPGGSTIFAKSGPALSLNASGPKPTTMPTAAASVKTGAYKDAVDKLEALVKKGTPITLDSFTPSDYSLLCSNHESCELLVKNVAPESVHAKKDILSAHACLGTAAPATIKKLPEGNLRKAWMEVCSLSDSKMSLLLIVGIIAIIILVVAVAGGIYFMYRRQ